jgi:hypothetical protein
MHYFIGTRNTSDTINTLLLKWHSSLEDLACCWRSELVLVVLLTEASSTYICVDALRRTQYRTTVGSLENAFLCCALFTKPYHSNDGAVLLRLCVAMGMLLHSNEHLQISTVADRLSMFATCGRIPWKAPTDILIYTLLFSLFLWSALLYLVNAVLVARLIDGWYLLQIFTSIPFSNYSL